MRYIKMSLITVLSTILAIAGLASITNVASATECAGYYDNAGNCVVESIVKGAATFSVDETAKAYARVVLAEDGRVYLTVRVKDMKRTPKCRKAPVGTPFWNEIVDPETGKHHYVRWHVEKGDQWFCPNKNKRGWKKASCGNGAKGIFDTPPPAKNLRIPGKVQIMDYVKYAASLNMNVQKHLSGSIQVTSPDGTCRSTATLDNDIKVIVRMEAIVKARSTAQAVNRAASAVTSSAGTDMNVTGSLKAEVDLFIQNKITTMCENRTPTPTTSPTPTPTPTPVTPPTSVVDTVNDVVEYNSRTIGFTLTGNPGETLQISADAKHGGSITAGKTQSITLDSKGNASGVLTYAAGEVPKSSLEYFIGDTKYIIATGKDVVWLQVRDTHGNTVWAKSNDFDITPRPVTP